MSQNLKQPVATIINFCTNESRFLRACLEQVCLFSKQVIIPVCDHFFDGFPENRNLLEQIYRTFPECLFIEYPFIPEKIPKRIFKEVSPAHFWHSCSRLIGTQFLDPSIEAVLFLDADEIPNGSKFFEWLKDGQYHHHTVMKFSNYWYFREPIYRALTFEDSVVLVQKRALTRELLMRQEERDALYDLLPGPKRRQIKASNGEPMFHHYSWVRTKEEMLRKVQSWGHRGDRDWVSLVEKEFAGPFTGADFIHGYQYQTVADDFAIRLEPPVFESVGKTSQVIRLKDFRSFLKFKKNMFASWIASFFSK